MRDHVLTEASFSNFVSLLNEVIIYETTARYDQVVVTVTFPLLSLESLLAFLMGPALISILTPTTAAPVGMS
jgi:hypothetical protein